MDIVTDIPTEWQMEEADRQQENAAIVRKFFDTYATNSNELDKFFAPNARVWTDSNTDITPIEFDKKKFFYGPEGIKEIRSKHEALGYSYDVTIHDIYTCGPIVLVTRTDNRKEAGKTDVPIPMTGAFAMRKGQILEWVDYYR